VQVLQYQNQCKKLPKALRDWQAFVDCRDTIDNFLEMLPLFQALAHKSMRERHWKAVMDCTGAGLAGGRVGGMWSATAGSRWFGGVAGGKRGVPMTRHVPAACSIGAGVGV
jgi:hypothetical protein